MVLEEHRKYSKYSPAVQLMVLYFLLRECSKGCLTGLSVTPCFLFFVPLTFADMMKKSAASLQTWLGLCSQYVCIRTEACHQSN